MKRSFKKPTLIRYATFTYKIAISLMGLKDINPT